MSIRFDIKQVLQERLRVLIEVKRVGMLLESIAKLVSLKINAERDVGLPRIVILWVLNNVIQEASQGWEA